MADPSINTIFVLIGICICAQLEVESIGGPYFDLNPDGDLAVLVEYDEDLNNKQQMQIHIFYDTETASAKDFFTSEITLKRIQAFNACSIVVFFNPCSTTKLDLNTKKLVCPKGQKQCDSDLIHACVANDPKTDSIAMAKLVICSLTSKTADECLDSKQKQNVDKCVRDGVGATFCNQYFTALSNIKRGYDLNLKGAAFNNFQYNVCWAMNRDGVLQCPAFCNQK